MWNEEIVYKNRHSPINPLPVVEHYESFFRDEGKENWG